MELISGCPQSTSNSNHMNMRFKRNCKMRTINRTLAYRINDESVDGICWIDLLPAEIMVLYEKQNIKLI